MARAYKSARTTRTARSSFKEFVALAKSKRGTIYYGSAGNGSSGHLAMEYLKQAANIELTHVPYKGTGPMVTDLLGGQTQATFTGATPLIAHIKQGKLRPLAVGGASASLPFPMCRRSRSRGSPASRRRNGMEFLPQRVRRSWPM